MGVAAKAGHEYLVEVLIAGPALEAIGIVEVKRLDRPVLVVGQGVRRGTIATSFNAVTLPAFHPPEDLLSGLDSVRRHLGLGRNLNRSPRFLRCEARRKMFHVGDEIGAVLLRERAPLWHVGGEQPAREGA